MVDLGESSMAEKLPDLVAAEEKSLIVAIGLAFGRHRLLKWRNRRTGLNDLGYIIEEDEEEEMLVVCCGWNNDVRVA